MLYWPMSIRGDESVIIRIDKSTSATALAKIMYTQGWIDSARLWVWLIKIQGLSSQLKAGIYQVQAAESAQHLLQRIVAGAVLRERFVIKPGQTQAIVTQNLMSAPYLEYKKEDWLVLSSKYPNKEGLLLADTYIYDAGSSAAALIQRAHLHMREVLLHAWRTRNPNLPYHSAYELLIVASILEKEAAYQDERKLISGVIVNRLKRHMPLQMDPTVIYALADVYHGGLSHDALAIDSPYNTYRHRGLPPAPIAMVSAAALDAARDPDTQSYLYFVAKGDGHHQFSTTYGEHLQAIRQYMRKPL